MMNDNGTYPVLGNTSDEPVYRCIVSIYDQPTGHKIAEYAQVDVLPPKPSGIARLGPAEPGRQLAYGHSC